MEDRTYRRLAVWRKSMDLAVAVYSLTRGFPREEQFRLTSQLIRASSSVPANISEGYMRGTRRDYAHFISIARGSCAETETFLILAERCGLAPSGQVRPALAAAEEVGRMLTALRRKLDQPPSHPRP